MGTNKVTGAVMVVGGGVAGMQAALDLANSGYQIYMVEKGPAIGGSMSFLDKTFPTNDCAMCIVSPKLVEVGRHINIQLLTLSEVQSIEGEEGDFTVTVKTQPRYVDLEKCIACGACAEKCPKKVPDDYNQGLNQRKAIYVRYPQAVPLKYAIDAQNCLYLTKGRCGNCKKVCPTGAVNYEDTEKIQTLRVGAVILAPGFNPFNPSVYEQYSYQRYQNVITALEMERILSASGPWLGHLVRPSDHKEPKRIAWLQCVGSRDLNHCDHPYCSAVCCMYAIKGALLSKEHSPQGVTTSIFYMDMRTYGKDFEKYYEKAQAQGVNFIRSRVQEILELPDQSLRLTYALPEGKTCQEEFDLVVLSQGLEAPSGAEQLASDLGFRLNSNRFLAATSFAPVSSSRPGIYACGVMSGPKDIPSSVMEASAAACAAVSKLSSARGQLTKEATFPPVREVKGEPPRVGVFVCSCGINIAGVIDVKAVTEYAATLPFVAHADNNLFSCSQDTQDRMSEVIKEKNLNRIVVAACTPRTHEPLFQETLQAAGLNKYLFEMANIRNHDSWVHSQNPEGATSKAKDLVRMAVAKAALLDPLSEVRLTVEPSALVVGGGVAGMNAALALAEQGYPTHLVEREEVLGGNARALSATAKGENISQYLAELAERIKNQPLISLHLNTNLKEVEGFVGNFKSILNSPAGEQVVEHGVTIIATGAREQTPTQYQYGQHPGIMTHLEMDHAFNQGKLDPREINSAVFIQCVGSREPEHPYCSKVCCTHAAKAALFIKEKNPAAQVIVLYRDMRTFGEKELLYRAARERGVLFVRYEPERVPEVLLENGRLQVKVRDHVLGRDIIIHPDLISLAAGMESRRDLPLAQQFKVPLDEDGWFLEAHQKLRPVDFATDGVFMAGLAHYPKPMEEAVAQALAAASRAATVLSRKEMWLAGTVANADQNKCVGCGMCWTVCPYQAISQNEKGLASVNEALCKGCGTCVTVCRSGAPNLRGFTTQEVMAQIQALP